MRHAIHFVTCVRFRFRNRRRDSSQTAFTPASRISKGSCCEITQIPISPQALIAKEFIPPPQEYTVSIRDRLGGFSRPVFANLRYSLALVGACKSSATTSSGVR